MPYEVPVLFLKKVDFTPINVLKVQQLKLNVQICFEFSSCLRLKKINKNKCRFSVGTGRSSSSSYSPAVG